MPPKQKYSTEDLKNEMFRVFEENKNRIPIVKEWKNFSDIDSSTVSRRFGKWKNAWDKIGISTKKQSIEEKRVGLINDFKKAYYESPDINSNYELIKISGHRIGVIQKYFTSLDRFINTVKLDARQKVNKEGIISDYMNVYGEIGSIPTKKDILKYGKYRLFLYLKYFSSLDDIAKLTNVDKQSSKISTEELIKDLKSVAEKLKRTPTTDDVYKLGKFSLATYSRSFGSFSAALDYAGLKQNKKEKSVCEYCGMVFNSIVRHLKNNHPDILEHNEQEVMRLYRNGLSNRKIAISGLTIFDSASSVSRVVKKHTTKDEREKYRIEKISQTTNENYASGRMDRVILINREKNSDITINERISETLKQSYSNGKKVSWNIGKTKENDDRIKQSAEKTGETMKDLYNSGQLERKQSAINKRYKLGAGFTSSDRRNIKKRANYRCEKCGITQEEIERNGKFLECDHVLPVSKGGLDDWKTNGQALCPECHLKKTNNKGFYISETNSIYNDLDCYVNEIIVHNGNELYKNYIKKLSYQDRHNLSLDLLDFFSRYDFKNIRYDDKIIKKEMDSLLCANLNVNEKIITNRNNIGIRVCRNYFPNILNITKNNKKSVYDVLTDREMLFKTIRNRLGGMTYDNFDEFFNITPANIITGAKNSGLAVKGSIFKPMTAKIIYQNWVKDGDVVYDYSGGFGGRLLGFYATRINAKYIGTDVEPDTYIGLQNMSKDLDINSKIYNVPSEEFIPSEKINFAFSSPPYFDHEIYSDYEKQSCIRYNSYNKWLSKYWQKTVQNIKQSLEKDGVFAVNAGNFSSNIMNKMYHDMKTIIESEGFAEIDRWYMESRTIRNKTKQEPINFYRLRA